MLTKTWVTEQKGIVAAVAEPIVYVVDTDPVSRDAICRLAVQMRFPYQACPGGQEFLERYEPGQTGCLVTEIRVPDISGLQIQKRLARTDAPLSVVFLTAHGSIRDAVRAMRSGAFHFLQKPATEQELWDAIQEGVGESRRRREVWAKKLEFRQRLATLTPEERQVFAHLETHDSSRQIASELGVSVRTIELRRNRLMEKLGVGSLVELLRVALLFEGEDFA